MAHKFTKGLNTEADNPGVLGIGRQAEYRTLSIRHRKCQPKSIGGILHATKCHFN